MQYFEINLSSFDFLSDIKMHMSYIFSTFISLSYLVSEVYDDTDLIIKTDKFTVKGMVSPNTTDVRIFKGIPYAEPPTGVNRFRPPITKKPTNHLIDANNYAPICIQYSTGAETVYTEYITGDLPYSYLQQSEDCLYLNIWAPRAIKNSSASHDVMIWIHGGGFTSGSAANPYKEGTSFAKNQDVIIVSMNYRLNIFGFPNAAALDGVHLNPGLLDIRKAVEWTCTNIAAFGSIAVDTYSYAYATDPLVNRFISESGLANPSVGASDPSGSNFRYVAEQLNCTKSLDKDDIFKCVQKIAADDLIAVYNTYNPSVIGGLSLSFGPRPDNETAFANYTDRRSRGLYAQKAYFTGSNENEFTSLITYVLSGPNQTQVDLLTASQFDCPTMISTADRAAQKTPQWRYWWRGIYPNQNPLPWLGAYHSSEIPLVWGTSDYAGPNTPVESAMSVYMQTAWATFAKSPMSGLTNYGWPLYDPLKPTLVNLGDGNSTTAVFADHSIADILC